MTTTSTYKDFLFNGEAIDHLDPGNKYTGYYGTDVQGPVEFHAEENECQGYPIIVAKTPYPAFPSGDSFNTTMEFK